MLTTNEEIPESEEIGPQDDQLLDDSEDVQMTVRYLKLVSGQFDLEAIRQLNFSNFGTISRIQCLEKCRYLEYLDISRNKLKKIEGLDALTHLKRLNLSYNFIQRLEGVEKLKRLEQLNLMNNSISNLQDLMCLSNCTTLSDVNLKNNPISSISQYTQSLHGIVKKLVIVDGEHILLRIPQLEFNEVQQSFEKMSQDSLAPWIQIEQVEFNPTEFDGVDKFGQVIQDSRKVLARADSILETVNQ